MSMYVSTRTSPQESPRNATDDGRILSEATCKEIAARVGRVLHGGGAATMRFWSHWVAGVRWGRNRILDSYATTEHWMNLQRFVDARGSGYILCNELTDVGIEAAVRRAEVIAARGDQSLNWELVLHRPWEAHLTPVLFDETTYNVDGATRVTAAMQLIQQAEQAGMWSAGYLEVSGHSIASLDTSGHNRYFQYTWAQCSVTVRDPAGTGSGWAGVDWPVWSKIIPAELGKVALDKCLQSRKPARVEPGRYTTILEPQAVFDLVSLVFGHGSWGEGLVDRGYNEGEAANPPPFQIHDGLTQLGSRVTDPRLTIGADPMDPELGFPPFLPQEDDFSDDAVYHPLTYVKDGILTELGYKRRYGEKLLKVPEGKPVPGSFRMSGGTTSIAEMIASTPRGILVTRFSDVALLESRSTLVRAYTRDGTWLIEHGAITKPIANLVATEGVLFVLNNIEQLGKPQRIWNPPTTWFSALAPARPEPAVVPPLKVRDFSFTALLDAV